MRQTPALIGIGVFCMCVGVAQAASRSHGQKAKPLAAASATTTTTASHPVMIDLMKTIKFPPIACTSCFGYHAKLEGEDYDDYLKVKPQPMLVPADIRLLSQKKKVTASEEPFIGDLELVTDGDRLGVDNRYIEFDEGRQWIQVDLGKQIDIYVVALWHRVYGICHDVVVQFSDDEKFTKNVITVFNNDRDNSSKLGKGQDREYIDTHLGRLIDCRRQNGKPVSARYIRVYGNGTYNQPPLANLAEVEVYGKEPK